LRLLTINKAAPCSACWRPARREATHIRDGRLALRCGGHGLWRRGRAALAVPYALPSLFHCRRPLLCLCLLSAAQCHLASRLTSPCCATTFVGASALASGLM
jgi:hypothetical protein